MDTTKLTQDDLQTDIKRATNAINAGSGLSLFNSILHIAGFVLLLAYAMRTGMGGLVITVPTGFGLLFSWAITYSLLSLVVTNAITARHTIILSSTNRD